jgi:hypothetical protein
VAVPTDRGGGPFAQLDLTDVAAALLDKSVTHLAVVQAALPALHPTGSITLIGGATADMARPATTGVAAANAAARVLAVELAPRRVNVVAPGVIIDTPWWHRVPAGRREALFADTAARTLAERVGTATDVAHAVRFLIENSYVAGVVLDLDAGCDYARDPQPLHTANHHTPTTGAHRRVRAPAHRALELPSSTTSAPSSRVMSAIIRGPGPANGTGPACPSGMPGTRLLQGLRRQLLNPRTPIRRRQAGPPARHRRGLTSTATEPRYVAIHTAPRTHPARPEHRRAMNSHSFVGRSRGGPGSTMSASDTGGRYAEPDSCHVVGVDRPARFRRDGCHR